jgi:hypothetical protein
MDNVQKRNIYRKEVAKCIILTLQLNYLWLLHIDWNIYRKLELTDTPNNFLFTMGIVWDS